VQPVLGRVVPRQPAIQRERDRVEDRRLAGASWALEQEQAAAGELVEVDSLRRRVRAEGLQFERVQPHQAAAGFPPAR
jgi:hypothetical protein